MIRIGLTGGVASGKSTALSFFKELGCNVLSSDDITKRLLEKDQRLIEEIKKNFGCVDEKGKVDKRKLGNIIFNNEKQKKKLEDLVHPIVKKVRKEFFKLAEMKGKNNFIVCETPLLFEKKLIDEFDYSVVIVAGLDTRAERFIKDKKGTQEDFFKICNNQMLDVKKVSMADFVIKNNGTREGLRRKIIDVLTELKQKTKQ